MVCLYLMDVYVSGANVAAWRRLLVGDLKIPQYVQDDQSNT